VAEYTYVSAKDFAPELNQLALIDVIWKIELYPRDSVIAQPPSGLA